MTGNNPSRIVVTDRDRQLLAFLSEAKLLDREQIQQLLDFGSVTRANDRLSRLHAAGLLYRYFVGTVAGGRKALYAISPRGAATIGQAMVWKLHRSQSELLVGEPGVEHQLAVNWCWISMRRGPDCNLFRFVRFNEPISPALPLAPDGYAEVSGSEGIQPVFLEVDLTTETSRVPAPSLVKFTVDTLGAAARPEPVAWLFPAAYCTEPLGRTAELELCHSRFPNASYCHPSAAPAMFTPR